MFVEAMELSRGSHIPGPLVAAADLSFLRDYARRLAWNRALPVEDADEVVQETLIRVIRSEGWIEVQAKPEGVRRLYLKTTARRVLRDMALKMRRQGELAWSWLSEHESDDGARADAVERLSELLPGCDEVELIVAYHLEGMEASEVITHFGGRYGNSKEAVRQRVSRAMKRLRAALEERA